MMTACEAVTQHIFPTVRAMIAQELVETYGLTQKEAAERMGLTQPAISQYRKHLRGHRSDVLRSNDKVLDKIDEISSRLAKGEMDAEEATAGLCDICREVRRSGLLDRITTDVTYTGCDLGHD